MKVYAVESGDYSDYRVDSLHSTKERAEAYIKRRSKIDRYYNNEASVVERTVDEESDEWLNGNVSVYRVYIHESSADVSVSEVEYGAEWESEDSGRMDDRYRALHIYAKDEQHAAKIAMEKRSVWLANKGGR
jgi:hypothetical protein